MIPTPGGQGKQWGKHNGPGGMPSPGPAEFKRAS